MRSVFKELEDNLYNVINAAPLTIEAKYYVVQGVFKSLESAYQQWLNMEEPQEEEPIEETTEVQKTENEDGTTTISAQGPIDKAEEVVNKVMKEIRTKGE